MAASQVELAHCPTCPDLDDRPYLRCAEPQEGAAEEIALTLRLAPITAARRLASAAFAYQSVPAAWVAWRDGVLSSAKLLALEEVCVGASEETVTALVEILLSEEIRDRAGRSNRERARAEAVGVFKRRARALVMMLDPDAVTTRRAARLADRQVRVDHDIDGLASLTGVNLPVESVAAADALLRDVAAQLKHRGDLRTVAAIRADVFLALLCGHTVAQILAAHGIRYDADERGDTPGADEAYVSPWRAGPEAEDRPDPAHPAPDADWDPSAIAAEDAARAAADPAYAREAGIGDTSGGQLAYARLDPTIEPPDPDQCPAESACVDAADMAALHDLLHPEDPGWDTTGWPDDQPPPAPPDEPPSSAGPAAGGLTSGGAVFGLRSPTGRKPLIELVVPYDVLVGGSTPGLAGGYGLIPADVLRDLLAQAAAAPSDWCLTVVADGRVVRHARTAHDPTVAQARFVRARDRRCTFPGCQRTADRCDLDHRRAWEKGGPTCPCNLHPLCRQHHRVKQADGWKVERDPHTGLTRWSTPHGLTALNDTDNPDPPLYQTNQPAGESPPGGVDPPGDTDPPSQTAA